MTVTSIGRIVVLSLALVAGAALVFSIAHVRREPLPETKAATVAPVVSVSPPDKVAGALITAQAEPYAVAAIPAVSPRSDADESVPAFDIARIDRMGDAVIAGRAAPGAIVELLRNGERHDRAVADQSGQFVMVPPRLPVGEYELTLRSNQPNGKQATSKHNVAVALAEVESSSGLVLSRAEVPFNVPDTVVVNRSVLDRAVGSPQAHLPSQLKITTKVVVSPGDSLWRISHVTYGAGLQYALIYKANQAQIRDPNRIYPGQIFVLPIKAR